MLEVTAILVRCRFCGESDAFMDYDVQERAAEWGQRHLRPFVPAVRHSLDGQDYGWMLSTGVFIPSTEGTLG